MSGGSAPRDGAAPLEGMQREGAPLEGMQLEGAQLTGMPLDAAVPTTTPTATSLGSVASGAATSVAPLTAGPRNAPPTAVPAAPTTVPASPAAALDAGGGPEGVLHTGELSDPAAGEPHEGEDGVVPVTTVAGDGIDPAERTPRSFHLSRQLLERARAAAHWAGKLPELDEPTNVSELVERALRGEVERLERTYNSGVPFPAVQGKLRTGPGASGVERIRRAQRARRRPS